MINANIIKNAKKLQLMQVGIHLTAKKILIGKSILYFHAGQK